MQELMIVAIFLGLPVERVSKVVSRFWLHVQKAADCWLWTGYLSDNGYGKLYYRTSDWRYVHRLSYVLNSGRIPDQKEEVCHRCDVPACVRPEHLFIGTRLDNVRDMIDKGRGGRPPMHHGEEHPQAVLTDVEVADLRRLHATGSYQQRALAKQFGVSQSTVWRLVHQITRAEGAR